MKTLVKITPDHNSTASYDAFKADINCLANELNIFCEIKNNDFINIIEEQKRYVTEKDEYTDSIVIDATGYSQSDWQTYTIHYNKKEIEGEIKKAYFYALIKELKRSFTHFNDYFCEKFEYIETKKGKLAVVNEPYDFVTICVDTVEFPTKENIETEYLEIYGKDFDKIEILEE